MTSSVRLAGAPHDQKEIEPMNIYLSGPMRNYPEFNHPAFHEAAAALRNGGHTVLSPAEQDNENGFDFTGTDGAQKELDAAGFDFRVTLAADLTWICRNADAVVVLPGWEASLGAIAEAAAAHALGLPIWIVADFLADGADASPVVFTAGRKAVGR